MLSQHKVVSTKVDKKEVFMLMTDDKRIKLANMTTAPYVALATMLICKGRRSSGNQFRHQMETRTILIDYGYVDSILHKAALVHDLIEDLDDFDRSLIISADSEGPAVYSLVLEVTRQKGEDKKDFLTRIREQGSPNAKLIKCADRISNMIAIGLGLNTDREFINRYCKETEDFILPIAREVDKDMYTELSDLVVSRRKLLTISGGDNT
jgi:GTP pyrophosphokinase